jgi:H+-transporting ATPase
VATLIAVYGLFMTPIGWGYAGFVWGYAVAWFFLNDRVKLLAYRIFDSPKAAAAAKANEIAARVKEEAKPDAKAAAPAPEAKADAKLDAKAAAQAPEAAAEPKPDAKAAAPAPEAKAEAKPDAKAAAPAPEAKAEPKPDAKAAAPVPEAKAEPKPGAAVEATPNDKVAPAPAAKSKATSDLTPQLVERVHALYEELGRQDVLAVQELEQAQKASKKEADP